MASWMPFHFCRNRIKFCWQLLVHPSYTVCVWVCCSVTNTDKCNSNEHCNTLRLSSFSPIVRRLGLARGASGIPCDPAHTDISNQARRNPIQGRSMPPTQAEPQADGKRENHSNAGVGDPGDSHHRQHLTDRCSSGAEPLTIDLIPCLKNGHLNATGSAEVYTETYFTKVRTVELALLAYLGKKTYTRVKNKVVSSIFSRCGLNSLKDQRTVSLFESPPMSSIKLQSNHDWNPVWIVSGCTGMTPLDLYSVSNERKIWYQECEHVPGWEFRFHVHPFIWHQCCS